MSFHLYTICQEVEENGSPNFLTWFIAAVLEAANIIFRPLKLFGGLILLLCEFSYTVYTLQTMYAGV